MNRRRSRFTPAFSLVNEALESRIALSGIAVDPGMHIAAHSVRSAATATTLSETAGTLGQPITFTVTVRAPASAGAPQGTVELSDHGQVIHSLALTPTTSKNPRFATSEATYTLDPQPGGGAYFFGKHPITASFVPSEGFSRSHARKTFTVVQPSYTTLDGGVKVATIAPGSGPEIQPGQSATVLYTGYLARGGQIFDDSSLHGGAPFTFTPGSGQVIPGFDAGTAGMKVGETRIVQIPPSQGYGSTANGPIPANSTLIFVLTLEAIS
jgi:hypothetical protein